MGRPMWITHILRRGCEVPMSLTTTLQETTMVLTKLANDVDTWIRHGVEPPLPEALVLAAERITTAMKVSRPTAPIKQMPISQLVIYLAVPGEEITAKDLWNRLAQRGWNTTSQAISVALHRAVVRGLFERPRRGVYRLAVTQDQSELAKPALLAEEPSAVRQKIERSHVHALAKARETSPP